MSLIDMLLYFRNIDTIFYFRNEFMKIFSMLCFLQLTTSLALVCHNNQYDELAQLILNSDLEGFKTAVADCALTQGEKLSLRSLADDMSVKRCKTWERIEYFGRFVPLTLREGVKLSIALTLFFFSPIALSAVVDSFANARKKSDTIWLAAGGIAACVAAFVAGIHLFKSVNKSLDARRDEAIRIIGELYTNAMNIRALLYGLV